MRSDEELMSAVAGGDLTAFEQLVRRYHSATWRTAFRLVGDLHTAEDISQEAFLRILRAADRYQPTAAFHTYFYRIVTRLCRDYHRKASLSLCQNLGTVENPLPSPEVDIATKEERVAVQDAIASLSTKQREAVVLRYYEEMSYEEIAEITGSSQKGVERLLARARAALGILLKNFLEK